MNTWLRFAEAKNGLLIATTLGAIYAISRLLFISQPSINDWARLYLGLSVVQLGLAAALGLVSFAPQLKLPWLFGTGQPSADDNLLFFGDIAKYKPRAYLASLVKLSDSKSVEITDLEVAFANQIVTNSRIAERKLRSFNSGVWLTIAALFTPLAAIALYQIERRRRDERAT